LLEWWGLPKVELFLQVETRQSGALSSSCRLEMPTNVYLNFR